MEEYESELAFAAPAAGPSRPFSQVGRPTWQTSQAHSNQKHKAASTGKHAAASQKRRLSSSSERSSAGEAPKSSHDTSSTHPSPSFPSITSRTNDKSKKPKRRRHLSNVDNSSGEDELSTSPAHPSIKPNDLATATSHASSRIPLDDRPKTPNNRTTPWSAPSTHGGVSEPTAPTPTVLGSGRKSGPARRQSTEAHFAPGTADQRVRLATEWLSWTDLTRLEAAGELRIKKGRFDDREERILREALEKYRERNRLTEDDVLERINGGRTEDRRGFWSDLAMLLPGRPLRAVQAWVKRLYDSRGKQGKWTEEEDRKLANAYVETPGGWTEIAKRVGRTELSCRDRFRVLSIATTKVTGHWTEEEQAKLRRVVAQVKHKMGRGDDSDVPWAVVAAQLGGIKTEGAVRYKWLAMQENKKAERQPKPGTLDYQQLVQGIKNTGVTKRSQVPWDDLCTGRWADYSGRRLERVWRDKLRPRVSEYQSKTLSEQLEELEKLLDVAADDLRPGTNLEDSEGYGRESSTVAGGPPSPSVSANESTGQLRLDEEARKKKEIKAQRRAHRETKAAVKEVRKAKRAKKQAAAQAAAASADSETGPNTKSKAIIEDSDAEADGQM